MCRQGKGTLLCLAFSSEPEMSVDENDLFGIYIFGNWWWFDPIGWSIFGTAMLSEVTHLSFLFFDKHIFTRLNLQVNIKKPLWKNIFKNLPKSFSERVSCFLVGTGTFQLPFIFLQNFYNFHLCLSKHKLLTLQYFSEPFIYSYSFFWAKDTFPSLFKFLEFSPVNNM